MDNWTFFHLQVASSYVSPLSPPHGGLSPLVTTMPIHCGVQLSSAQLNSLLDVAKRLLVKDILNHLDNVAHQVYYSPVNDGGANGT